MRYGPAGCRRRRYLGDMRLRTGSLPGFRVTKAAGADGAVSISVVGEIDMQTAPALTQVIEETVASVPPEVSLDLEECPFIDSSGIVVLVRAATDLAASGRALTVRHAQRAVRNVLRTAGIDQINGLHLGDEAE